MTKLNIINNKNIDRSKWDAAIENSICPKVYALSWYLDIVCPNWEAIIINDYEIVFPLPVFKKWGIKKLVRPFFTQQLGVFSSSAILPSVHEDIINLILKEFKIINISTYHKWGVEKKITENYKTNYILNLQQPYSTLMQGYSENTKRNIQQARNQDVNVEDAPDFETILDCFKNETGKKIDNLKDQDYKMLHELALTASQKGIGHSIHAIDKNEAFCSGIFYLQFKNRIYNIIPCSTESGKEFKAMFLILNYLIQKNADSNKILDFEGSEIEGVARFYKGFGAVNEPYYQYYFNNMPLLLKSFF